MEAKVELFTMTVRYLFENRHGDDPRSYDAASKLVDAFAALSGEALLDLVSVEHAAQDHYGKVMGHSQETIDAGNTGWEWPRCLDAYEGAEYPLSVLMHYAEALAELHKYNRCIGMLVS